MYGSLRCAFVCHRSQHNTVVIGDNLDVADALGCCTKIPLGLYFPRFEKSAFWDPDLKIIVQSEEDETYDRKPTDLDGTLETPAGGSGTAIGVTVAVLLVIVCLGVAFFAWRVKRQASDERAGIE